MTPIRRGLALAVCLLVWSGVTCSSRAAALAAPQTVSCGPWRVVPTPPPTLYDAAALNGISGTSSQDVWAVGGYGAGPLPPVIRHWNGSTWFEFSSVGVDDGSAFDVVAISPADVWVVGWILVPVVRPLILHWDGIR